MTYLLGRGLRRVIAGAMTLAVLTSTPIAAEDVLATRLGELLGQERQALAVVPSTRLSALTAPPAAITRNVSTAPAQLEYSEAFLASVPAASGNDQWQCLTEALYFEARGETVKGLFAVGEVILNRADSASFPQSVCSVVHQGTGQRYACQFTYTCDGSPETVHEPAAWSRVAKVARLLMDGAPRDLTAGATYYHTKGVNPSWARRFDRTATIGAHYFYRAPVRTASN